MREIFVLAGRAICGKGLINKENRDKSRDYVTMDFNRARYIDLTARSPSLIKNSMAADISQTLRDTENALRDFVAYILEAKLGCDWEERAGVSQERLAKWKERKTTELRRQKTGAVDERLIYYADFYDLRTILKKHWHHFAEALGEFRTIEVWLTELEKIRDPEAHHRELLPHQKDLARGIAGEIRTSIARFRSAHESGEAYYPRIEFAADNLGNSWKPGQNDYVKTGLKLRPGDVLEYFITATDPLGEPLEYLATLQAGSPMLDGEWQHIGSFQMAVTDAHVGRLVFASLLVRSRRKYRAHGGWDDSIEFVYEVLPP